MFPGLDGSALDLGNVLNTSTKHAHSMVAIPCNSICYGKRFIWRPRVKAAAWCVPGQHLTLCAMCIVSSVTYGACCCSSDIQNRVLHCNLPLASGAQPPTGVYVYAMLYDPHCACTLMPRRRLSYTKIVIRTSAGIQRIGILASAVVVLGKNLHSALKCVCTLSSANVTMIHDRIKGKLILGFLCISMFVFNLVSRFVNMRDFGFCATGIDYRPSGRGHLSIWMVHFRTCTACKLLRLELTC